MFGGKSIEKNAGVDAVEKGKQVEEYFTVTDKDLELKRTKVKVNKKGKETKVYETYVSAKRVCHVADASDYVQHLIKLRGLDPAKTLVRLGLDGGGGSLKVLVSVFDPTIDGGAPDNWMDLENDDEWIFEGSVVTHLH